MGVASHPWERLHIDYAGPFLGKMFLMVVDAHSKWLEVEIVSSATSANAIAKLRAMFATHGHTAHVLRSPAARSWSSSRRMEITM